jgi:hypothetical protein
MQVSTIFLNCLNAYYLYIFYKASLSAFLPYSAMNSYWSLPDAFATPVIFLLYSVPRIYLISEDNVGVLNLFIAGNRGLEPSSF